MRYTTIDQGAGLAARGLNPRTADLWYDDSNKLMLGAPGKNYYRSWMPCWSTDALLDLLPESIEIKDYKWYNRNWGNYEFKDIEAYRVNLNSVISFENDTWDFAKTFHGETMFESAFNAVVWLLENNYLMVV